MRRRVTQVLRTGDISPDVDMGSERSKTTRSHVGRRQCSDVVGLVDWHVHGTGRIPRRYVARLPAAGHSVRLSSLLDTSETPEVRLTTS